jgi:hypothetical protein
MKPALERVVPIISDRRRLAQLLDLS